MSGQPLVRPSSLSPFFPSFSLTLPPGHPPRSRERARAGITISSLHAGWILIEAQRIKLLKIRLSLLVVLLVLLLLAHPPYPFSPLPRPGSRLFASAATARTIFLSRFFISRIFIDSYNSSARRARKESRAREEATIVENLFGGDTYKPERGRDRVDALLRVIKFVQTSGLISETRIWKRSRRV